MMSRSTNGLGALLLQDGFPIAYASRSITATQVRDAKISCERFHPYIYDKTVEVHSHYKPFEYILKNHLATAPAILQRMPLRLQKYDNNLVYKR